MISIDFSLAIALYAILLLGTALMFWVFAGKGKAKHLTLEQKYIWHCSVCTYTYINTKEDLISVCPRCANYNKK